MSTAIAFSGVTRRFGEDELRLEAGSAEAIVGELVARFLPNTYAVDPLRELLLFRAWPAGWLPTLLILGAFAAGGLVVGCPLASRQLRRLG